jgi:hypothetical protein
MADLTLDQVNIPRDKIFSPTIVNLNLAEELAFIYKIVLKIDYVLSALSRTPRCAVIESLFVENYNLSCGNNIMVSTINRLMTYVVFKKLINNSGAKHKEKS